MAAFFLLDGTVAQAEGVVEAVVAQDEPGGVAVGVEAPEGEGVASEVEVRDDGFARHFGLLHGGLGDYGDASFFGEFGFQQALLPIYWGGDAQGCAEVGVDTVDGGEAAVEPSNGLVVVEP